MSGGMLSHEIAGHRIEIATFRRALFSATCVQDWGPHAHEKGEPKWTPESGVLLFKTIAGARKRGPFLDPRFCTLGPRQIGGWVGTVIHPVGCVGR